MTDQKEKRLSKVAKEFNIAVATIVDFLRKKGVTVDLDPNAKIAPEYYEMLLKEFSTQRKVKKESEQLDLRKKERKETLTIADAKIKEETPKHKSEEVLIIKDISGRFKKEEPVLEDKKSSKNEKKELGLNILGKIDLDNLNQKVRPEKKVHSKIEEIVKPEIIIEEPLLTIENDEKVMEITEIEEETSFVSEPIVEEILELAQISEDEQSSDNFIDEIVSEDEIIDEDEMVDEDEMIFIDIPDLQDDFILSKEEEIINKAPEKEKGEHDLKVVGRIDLDALNQKTRPAKKTKKQKEDERRQKAKERRLVKDASKVKLKELEVEKLLETGIIPEGLIADGDQLLDSKIFRTEIKKLSGPTVVGRINIADKDSKKKPVASSDKLKFKSNKKKRKRKNKETVAVQENTESKDKKAKPERKVDLIIERKKQKFAKKLRQVVKKEVNEEDVQKQIKETLARLTAGKQKSKGSKLRRLKRENVVKKQQEEAERQEHEKKILKVTEFIAVNELATMMGVAVTEVISTCMNMGLFVGINQRLDADTITVVSDEFGYEVEFISIDVKEAIEEEDDLTINLHPRPPIVTVMGHVDHGKTSLLDYIRHTNVIAGEAGGITQHIGAYTVTLENDKRITFLDTPGHQAFTAMRARGAKVTDIAIIVVAADDNVMPQTIEAINHAKAAQVPIVFAINKIDKAGANPDRIKEELAKMNYLIEEWGGKYQSQDISAKKGINMDELLEKLLLEAEMLDLKANPDKRAAGTVIESSLDKGRGYVATLLVANGKISVGDVLLAGCYFGKVKAMYNERNQKVTTAGPSDPVLILGLNGAPQAGDKFNVMKSEREAKEIANRREQILREQGLRTQKHITLDEIGRRIAIGGFQELNLIVKGDVDGSVEALTDALIKLSTPKIQVNVIHKAVGQIAESDIMLASASNAIIIGFQVRPSTSARKIAEAEGIDIRLYSIIYNALNEIKDAMEGMLSPEIKEDIIGTAEVLQIFKIVKVGTIAGCLVKDGKLTRTAKIRLIREGIVVYTGELGSLKRFKDDAREVKSGTECGLNINRFNDMKVGDIIEAFEETEVKQLL